MKFHVKVGSDWGYNCRKTHKATLWVDRDSLFTWWSLTRLVCQTNRTQCFGVLVSINKLSKQVRWFKVGFRGSVKVNCACFHSYTQKNLSAPSHPPLEGSSLVIATLTEVCYIISRKSTLPAEKHNVAIETNNRMLYWRVSSILYFLSPTFCVNPVLILMLCFVYWLQVTAATSIHKIENVELSFMMRRVYVICFAFQASLFWPLFRKGAPLELITHFSLRAFI